MQIEKNRVVSLTYTLSNKAGEVEDQTTAENPFMFIHGIGQTLPSFDDNLIGLKSGDSFSFEISAEDGYGQTSEEMIVNIPASVFSGPDVPENLIQVGNMVPMQDNMGNPMYGKILNFDAEFVTMDFNHVMAGKDLFFTGSIIEVREATPEELSHKHVHGPGGHHH